MAPKKQKQKMTLGDFLGDERKCTPYSSKFGSWADEMENLPTAPAARADDAPSDRYGRGERATGPPREDLPLPTAPPYTVFVGNLSFDLVEDDLAQFFSPEALKSVKVIRDRDEKPKGFGYVEFETLDGLKNGIAKSGTQLNSRTIRVSVAEPPKERERASGFGDESSNWRRDGPMPGSDRGNRGSRFDDRPPREPVEPSQAEVTSDWRSMQPARSTIAPAEPARRSGSGFRDAPPRGEMNWERKSTMAEMAAERPAGVRRGSGFSTPGGDREPSAAETDEVWQRGPPRAAPAEEPAPRRGGFGGNAGGGPPDTGDWRSQMKGPGRQGSMDNKSPTSSQPQTPQGGRKPLGLLPRSTGGSNVASPLSSPRMAAASGSKANPFGAAKPVDVTSREREVSEKLDRDRESRPKDKAGFGGNRSGPISRQGSTSGPPTRTQSTPRDRSPADEEKKERPVNKFDAKAAQVRATTSFAAAAGNKKDDSVNEAAEKLAEVTV